LARDSTANEIYFLKSSVGSFENGHLMNYLTGTISFMSTFNCYSSFST